MLEQLRPIADACDLTVPEWARKTIGVVGAGAITRVAHLPAYGKAGLTVAGICDLSPERASSVAQEFGLPRTYTLDEMLVEEAIEIIDVAVVPEAQPEIVRKALAAGKHVLAQKPLAVDSERGAGLVEAARDAGRSLVVNHQMRYGEGMAAARAMAEAGWIGDVTAMVIDVDIETDFTAWDWLVTSPRLDLMYHSIHYFDTVRALLGDPTSVYCVGGRRPGQAVAGETRTFTTLTFDQGRRALVKVNHENHTGDQSATFRIDGSEGSIRGTIGLLYDYPHGRPDTLEVNSSRLPTDGWLPYPVTTRWIPDAFAGPMRALMLEIAGKGPAPTTAADGLRTLQLVEAGYASLESGAVIPF
ncbi:Gfo/Idh/MocA family oxidoreductase [Actinoplanes sp. LDG1-06]|uniref:Gfo/Idh/MocA family oxidoreductase n=1 Tax=Paractinoplanes ovalisporus TaxID=2810368 RepID=A0ABS2AR49_9ACTN|nr:Gfo/Idh/MocA family oxidoreductase [Actinoplanes ovalisporus]MBM2621818.1 Gfo/Idh/MocA family oxidoreductase [Actinoplanes ovalisporus]